MAERQFTNRLINETSPYLLQHAHNPVDWYPWGEEAFARAKEQNKPLLLSIGYSACHWCHVMAHESFENEDIARLMNENFVNVKVDREERPDLDQIYMNAVQMMTSHGGWPMTVFLTPEGVPFYGGTYFPPEDRFNIPGFPRVLLSIADAYRERPGDIRRTSESVLEELRRVSNTGESHDVITTDLLETAYRQMVRNYDSVEGGFGAAPKFPPAMALEFLLRTFYRSGRQEALDIVRHTCRKMANAGIYDQLAGGFHRYATDAKWLVPHFEKMLYDNALLSRLYLHVYQTTGDEFHRGVAEGILDYVLREMTHPLGGFYSSQDADSEGHEGKFFVWSAEEIDNLLGTEHGRLFMSYYNVSPAGNFEGKNILNTTRPLSELAAAENIPLESLAKIIEDGRRILFEAREKRVKPHRDEKILTAWNGLMLASFSEAGAILQRENYVMAARANAEFLLTHLKNGELLFRSWKDGQAKHNAYLEDYAFLVAGLIALFEATGTTRWLEEALSLVQKMIAEFWDESEGGFFFTGKSHESLIVRSRDYFDNATPSGNSVAADVLLRLALITGESDYQKRALTILRQIADLARRYPTGFGHALSAFDFYLGEPKEIAVILSADDAGTELLDEVWKSYLPNKIVVSGKSDDKHAQELIPLLRDRPTIGGKPTAYVCHHFACQTPVTDAKSLRSQLLAKAIPVSGSPH